MSSTVLLYCQYCGTDTQSCDVKYFGGEAEVYEYIVCSVCENLLASSTMHDKESYPTVDASGNFDRDASGDGNENMIDVEDIGLIDLTNDGDAGCTESLPLSLNHHQSLKNSYSDFDFEEKENFKVTSAYSSALDNGELSRESLKQARELYCRSLSCSSCTSPGSQIQPVEGVKDVFHCSSCSDIVGVDDSMNYYDLLQKGDYEVEACVSCLNRDPNLFVLERGNDPDSISLRCMRCGSTSDGIENRSSRDLETIADQNTLEQCMKEWIHYECKCKNADSDMQLIKFDRNSNTVFVKCWSCEGEDVISLNSYKPKICTCSTSEQQVNVKFDEYGYALQVICLQCRAEMDCGEPGTLDSCAAGDGRSTGRTRITCPTDIQIGDHIALHQLLGYWHHAIVTNVAGLQIRVVHYNGPNLPHKGMFHS